jgi:hypothetical protein
MCAQYFTDWVRQLAQANVLRGLSGRFRKRVFGEEFSSGLPKFGLQ